MLSSFARHFVGRRSFGSLIGKPAPAFAVNACMPDGAFKQVSLNDFKGKYVVLYFWPADFTYVCSSETIDFHNNLAKFKELGVELLGCSTDTAFVHKAWRSTAKADGGLGTEINHPMELNNHSLLSLQNQSRNHPSLHQCQGGHHSFTGHEGR